MVETQDRQSIGIERYSNHLGSLSGLRRAALEQFIAAGFPTSKDEEFRFTPLKGLQERQFHFLSGSSISEAEFGAMDIPKLDGFRLVFVNGQLSQDLSNLPNLPGIQFSVVEGTGAASEIATYDGKLGTTNDDRFLILNSALSAQTALLKILPGSEVSEPIHFVFVSTSDSAVENHTRIQVEAGERSIANIVETYVGCTGSSFTNAVSEFRIGSGAILKHVRFQNESLETIHLGQIWVHQEKESTYTSLSVQFGGEVGRVDVNVWLNGEHTETWLDGTYVGNGSQLLDNKTRIDHANPNCHSFEVYKGILDDSAHGVFNGKIFVYEDAQKTDAKQTNQALLLSPTATINTKPQLEIFADDVKCTHGATVGQLREEQLFYLVSRGIPASEAKGLLVYAFAAEVIEKIEIEALREYLEQRLFAKLAK